MEESQTQAVAVKKLEVPDLFPKMRESLARGIEALNARVQAIDVDKDGAEIEAQGIVASAREARELAVSRERVEASEFSRVVGILGDRWGRFKTEFENIRTLAKNKAQEALISRQRREAKVRQEAEDRLAAARKAEADEAERLAKAREAEQATPEALREVEAAQEAHREKLVDLRQAREATDALPPAGAPIGVVTGSGSLKPRETWTFEVEDFGKVPREYLDIDSEAVRAAIKGKDGLREIPGLRIFAETTLVDRKPPKGRQRALEG